MCLYNAADGKLLASIEQPVRFIGCIDHQCILCLRISDKEYIIIKRPYYKTMNLQ
jgi:hypothetical protein